MEVGSAHMQCATFGARTGACNTLDHDGCHTGLRELCSLPVRNRGVGYSGSVWSSSCCLFCSCSIHTDMVDSVIC